jgi:hypothetical protein
MSLVNISLIPLKTALVPQIAKNFPDSFSADDSLDPIIWSGINVAFINSIPGPMNGQWSYKNAVELFLPNLINGGWITFNPSDSVYHLSYGDKGLDHSSVNAVKNKFTGAWVSIIVTDHTLFGILSPFYKGLGIPQSEMDQLGSLINNKSGSNASNALLLTIGKYTVLTLAVVGAVVFAPAVAVTPAVATATPIAPAGLSYTGAGTLISSVQAGGVAGGIAEGAPLVAEGVGTVAGSVSAGGVAESIAGGVTGLEGLAVAPAVAGVGGNVINLAGSGVVQEIPTIGFTPPSLTDTLINKAETLAGTTATSAVTAQLKKLLPGQPAGGSGGPSSPSAPLTNVQPLQTPISPTPFLVLLALGAGFFTIRRYI